MEERVQKRASYIAAERCRYCLFVMIVTVFLGAPEILIVTWIEMRPSRSLTASHALSLASTESPIAHPVTVIEAPGISFVARASNDLLAPAFNSLLTEANETVSGAGLAGGVLVSFTVTTKTGSVSKITVTDPALVALPTGVSPLEAAT